MSRKSWAVVDVNRHNTRLVTRWRSYAGWWAAWWRMSEGADMRIVRRDATSGPFGPRATPSSASSGPGRA